MAGTISVASPVGCSAGAAGVAVCGAGLDVCGAGLEARGASGAEVGAGAELSCGAAVEDEASPAAACAGGDEVSVSLPAEAILVFKLAPSGVSRAKGPSSDWGESQGPLSRHKQWHFSYTRGKRWCRIYIVVRNVNTYGGTPRRNANTASCYQLNVVV